MKKLAYLLTLTLFGATFTSAAVAQDVNVVFVNSARIVEQAPQAKAAQEKIEKEFSSRKDELIAAQKKLKAAQEKLERDAAVMSEAERRKLERDVVTQQRELQRSQEAFREDLNLRRNEEFGKLQREAAKAISSIATEKGYDLVLEAGVVYASDRADITDAVIERLRKQGQ